LQIIPVIEVSDNERRIEAMEAFIVPEEYNVMWRIRMYVTIFTYITVVVT